MRSLAASKPVRTIFGGLLLLTLLGCPAGPPAGTVVSVTISGGDLELVVGEDQTLTAVVVSLGSVSAAVTWSSGRPTIASVDDVGELAALADGTPTITAASAGLGDALVWKSDPDGDPIWTRQFGKYSR